jgi:type III restriction enzyme
VACSSQFAESLQKEMENETGVKFGYLEEQSFSTITLKDEVTGESKEIGYDYSAKVYSFLVKEKFLDKKGKVENKLKEAIAAETFDVPDEFKEIKQDIERVIRNSIKKLPIFNKKDEVDIKLNKEVLLSDEFNQLWNQIKYKTTYSVDLDSDTL